MADSFDHLKVDRVSGNRRRCGNWTRRPVKILRRLITGWIIVISATWNVAHYLNISTRSNYRISGAEVKNQIRNFEIHLKIRNCLKCGRISMKLELIDSFFNVLQFRFYVQQDQTKGWSANPQKMAGDDNAISGRRAVKCKLRTNTSSHHFTPNRFQIGQFKGYLKK